LFGTFLPVPSLLLHSRCALLSHYWWQTNMVSNIKVHRRTCSHCLLFHSVFCFVLIGFVIFNIIFFIHGSGTVCIHCRQCIILC